MSNAYVETTILADVLLKPGTKKQARARSALSRYEETLLPVYSIKEWKAGALNRYAWLHDKFVQTRSLAATMQAISSINPYYDPRKKSTAQEAFSAATQLDAEEPDSRNEYPSRDEENADRYRLALAKLILLSWKRRRRITHRTIQELDCYTEAAPKIDRETGFIDLSPQRCSRDEPCCLEEELKRRPDLLVALRDSISESSSRVEDKNRRAVLKQLIKQPNRHLTEEQCRWLGDAIFAFFCPANALVLTTNIRDHKPLAEAVGKRAEAP